MARQHTVRTRAIWHLSPPRTGYHPPAALVLPRGFCAMKTFVATPANRQRDWYVVDAEGQTLGRLVTQIADTLRGKRKPEYTPHVDTGDFVVIVNADKVKVTGRKADVLEYQTYSRYPGGQKTYSYKRMLELHPEKLVELAVRRMLPKNKMGRNILGKLKVYKGDKHPHSAQQPKELKFA